jgi:hypothetical protein
VRRFSDQQILNIWNLNLISIYPDYETFIEFNGKQHYEPIEFFGGKKC